MSGQNKAAQWRGDPLQQFVQPYFITNHAIERYQQRVDRRARASDVIEIVQAGLQNAGPMYPPDRTIAIAERAVKPRFVAIIEPPRSGRPWPQVVTIWGWGVCPILLKRKRAKGPDKRYRWLNNPMPATRY